MKSLRIRQRMPVSIVQRTRNFSCYLDQSVILICLSCECFFCVILSD